MLNFRDIAVHFMNSSSKNMLGGAKISANNAVSYATRLGFLGMFLLVVLFFFLKAFLIYLTYNMVVPRIMMSLDAKGWERFRQITYWDAILLMILFNNLAR
jgi:hypothetical protein